MRDAPKRILVVEDDDQLAENFAEILEGLGYDTMVAESAERALELLRSSSFTGVITDFRLPGRDGVELIAELRRSGIAVPVVVVSAYMSGEAIERAEAAGALHVLKKPVELERLFALISEFARPGRRVLIVEDDASFAENVAEALRECGLEPIVELSGAAALAVRRLPTAALIDLRLPDLSGLDVARRLNARDPGLRLLFVTGYAEELRDVLAAIGSLPGLDQSEPYLTKPVDLARLVEWVFAATEPRG